jgi:4-hydroxythreonine-4-phosphate dehydrogenase
MPPRIGITMGDPAGIGSEITAKMLSRERIATLCIPLIIGDADVARQGFEIIGAEPDFEVIPPTDVRNLIALEVVELHPLHFPGQLPLVRPGDGNLLSGGARRCACRPGHGPAGAASVHSNPRCNVASR